jgi:hypothetical protein
VINNEKKKMILLSICCIAVYGQSEKDSLYLERKYAESELKLALRDKEQHNALNFVKTIIKDSLTATSVAETILFSIYGKANIVKQKPYKIHQIDNYWILWGEHFQKV